jgi:NAD(P)-dependent dehydrogenase (short-subunit alcohol dehydrogenase family)
VTTLLMSGASRGIGKHAAERLLHDDPSLRLLVVARSGTPLDHSRVTTIRGDLSSLESVREVADQIQEPLHGYAGNAGLQMKTATTTTADGFETTFGVNVLAHYLLIRLLWDRFAAPGRIVITGSDSHFGDFRHNLGMVPAPQWTDVNRLAHPNMQKGRGAYATSKLAVIYLVHALARRLPEGIDAYTFNPSFTPGTGLVRDEGAAGRLVWGKVLPLLARTPIAHSVAEAGDQLAAAITGPRPGPSGSYIDRATVAQSSPESYDEQREEELWRAAERLTGLARV